MNVENVPTPAVYNNLFSIDGVDGVGKSYTCEHVSDILQTEYGIDTLVISPVNPGIDVRSDRIRTLLDIVDPSQARELYHLILKRNMLEARALLDEDPNRVILFDSSYIRSMAFNDPATDLVSHSLTIQRVSEGTLSPFYPSNMLLLEGDSETVYARLMARGISKYDPQSLEALKCRADRYGQVFSNERARLENLGMNIGFHSFSPGEDLSAIVKLIASTQLIP